jgi:CDP-ribitol ribitolphosphotransferase
MINYIETHIQRVVGISHRIFTLNLIMANKFSKTIKLTILTPIGLTGGRLQNMRSWISSLGDLQVEVILVHDKKDENTEPELREMVNGLADSRICLLVGNYGGPGQARNAGLAEAKGEWVCFWDSDDLPQVEDFFCMVEAASASGSECAVGGFTAVHDVTAIRKPHELSKNYLDQIAINPGIWRFAFKRSAIEGLQFPRLLMAEDQLFLAKFGIPSRRIEIFPKSVYQYFVGEDFHLTRSKSALSDLPAAINGSFAILQTLNQVNVRFAAILLSRQTITAFRTGNSKVRLQVIKIFLSGLKNSTRRLRIDILMCMWFAIFNRESIL